MEDNNQRTNCNVCKESNCTQYACTKRSNNWGVVSHHNTHLLSHSTNVNSRLEIMSKYESFAELDQLKNC